MGKHLFSFLFSPRGRIDRGQFLLGLGLLFGFVIVQGFVYPALGVGMGQFWAGMVFFFLNLHIFMCVYGKRLHDLGRGLWPLVGLIFLTVFVALIVMLGFGGLEYFNALYDNPKIVESPDQMKHLHEVYQTRLAKARPMADIIIGGLLLVFTVWLAVTKGEGGDNCYGPAREV